MTDIAALYAATTHGEWTVEDDDDGPGGRWWSFVTTPHRYIASLDYMTRADAEFVAAIHNAWPDVAQRLRALEQENTQLRDAAQRMIHASPSTYQDEMMALEEALAALDAATEAQ